MHFFNQMKIDEIFSVRSSIFHADVALSATLLVRVFVLNVNYGPKGNINLGQYPNNRCSKSFLQSQYVC